MLKTIARLFLCIFLISLKSYSQESSFSPPPGFYWGPMLSIGFLDADIDSSQSLNTSFSYRAGLISEFSLTKKWSFGLEASYGSDSFNMNLSNSVRSWGLKSLSLGARIARYFGAQSNLQAGAKFHYASSISDAGYGAPDLNYNYEKDTSLWSGLFTNLEIGRVNKNAIFLGVEILKALDIHSIDQLRLGLNIEFRIGYKRKKLEPIPTLNKEDIQKLIKKEVAHIKPKEIKTPYIYVNEGDYLSKYSKAIYGQSDKWHEIFKLNSKSIKNPNLIYPGQFLKLPEQFNLKDYEYENND